MMQGGLSVAIGACDVWVITHHYMSSSAGRAMFTPNESIFFASAQQCKSLSWLQVAHILFHFSPLMSLSVLLAYK
jgi:hypothetical protein